MTFPAERYEEFLRSAEFGCIHLGADEVSVVKGMGPIDDVAPLGRSRRILAFETGHVQVTFDRGRVIHFGLYFRDAKRGPVVLANLKLSSKTTSNDLRAWLRAEQLAWDEHREADGIRIKLQNGVQAVFDGDLLDSLQVA